MPSADGGRGRDVAALLILAGAAIAIQVPLYDRWVSFFDEAHMAQIADELNHGFVMYPSRRALAAVNGGARGPCRARRRSPRLPEVDAAVDDLEPQRLVCARGRPVVAPGVRGHFGAALLKQR